MQKSIFIFLYLVNWSNGEVIPEKLLRYQNVTGIDDATVLKILNDSLHGNYEIKMTFT